MATQLFLLDSVADTHLGANNLNLLSSAVGWTSKALGTARGSGVIASDAVATVTGATAGVTVTKGSTAVEWISPPLAADATISGTITLNLWSSETNMNANVAINARIFVIRANATATQNSNTLATIATTARVTEVAVTTRAANNFTVTPTSTAVNRGDRLRVILFGDDVGTMAATYTFDASWNGTAAAADGDSYVTFTENITFESAPGFGQITSGAVDPTNLVSVGQAAGTQRYAATFVAPGDTLTALQVNLSKVGAPTDNLIIEAWTDSGGSPGSSVGTIATQACSALTTATAGVTFTYSGLSISLTPSSTYWIVFRRSGAVDASNAPRVNVTADVVSGPTQKYDGSAWTTATFTEIAYVLSATSSSSTTTVYLTDTASAVSTASVDREAWTSRGAGNVSGQVNSVTGWTAPLQMTDTAGGTVVDWFTRPLTAFTLTGMAVANLWLSELGDYVNGSARCEIARVAGDGTSPTVWASWCIAPTGTNNGEVSFTSPAARTANVSGDDLAITDGQRLRIRIYADDISSAAMAAIGGYVQFNYGATSGGTSGDSYVTFPQTLNEYSSGPFTYTKAGYGKEAG